MESVRSELEQTSQLAWWSGRPERELLHERGALGVDERFKLGVKLGELGMSLDVME